MLYISQIIDHYLIRFAFCGKTSLLLWQWSSWLVYFLAGRSFWQTQAFFPFMSTQKWNCLRGGHFFLPIVSPVTFMCGWWQSHWPHNYIVQFSGPAESNEKWNCLGGGGHFPKILNLNSVTSYIYDDDNLVSLTIIQFLGPDWSNWRAIQQFSNLKTDKRQVKRVFMRVGMNICPEAKRSPHLLA